MPSCSDVIRKLTNNTVTIISENTVKDDPLDQSMAIDQRTEFFQYELQNEDEGIINRAWTTEVPQLEKLKHSFPNRCWSWNEIAIIFKTLVLSGCSITYLDQEMLLFSNVTRLDVSSNKLTHVGELPPSLVGLFMNCNPLSSKAFHHISAPFLRFIDISFCELNVIPLFNKESFPSLCALDLSGNDICDISTLEKLRSLPLLTHLCFLKNPIVLRYDYRKRVFDLLPKITHLDDIQKSLGSLVKIPYSKNDNIMIRITIKSLRGLPTTGTSSNLYGEICVEFGNQKVSSPQLPWGKTLIMDEGDEPDVVEPVEEVKVDKKKGKGKVEEVVAAAPVIDRTIPQTLELIFPISRDIRDSILFDDLSVSVIRSESQPAPIDASESKDVSEVEKKADTNSEVIGSGVVSLKTWLQTQSSHEPRSIKETFTLNCPKRESSDSEVIAKVIIELNPQPEEK
mmetsp:Transcript_3625/g.4562  ORF Transcript_3625/g.4562 Transcript_3625/m.4562 type:complete len:454 (+) Transcript_3625:30-1391(+)